MSEATEASLRRRAETLLATKDEEIGQMPAENIRALVHELQVHKIELEMQNEELRQAQLELLDARDRYSDLYEFAPVGYITVDADGVVRGANLTAATMLRTERSLLIGARFGYFVTPEDRKIFSLTHAEVFDGGEKRTCEIRMLPGDQPSRVFRLESTPPGNQIPDDPVCFTALIDITSQNAAEELRLEQKCYRASEAEKTRISRELHDNLGSHLKGLEVNAVTLAKQLEADRSERAGGARKIAGWLEEAIKQARDLAIGLYPIYDVASLIPALERLAEFGCEAGLMCRLSLTEKLAGITDLEVANHLYRISQEAFHNAIRHSGASELSLVLELVRGVLVLRIGDNGCGIELDAVGDGSLGIQIMRYRARAIHGTLEIAAGRSGGTEVICRIRLNGTLSIVS